MLPLLLAVPLVASLACPRDQPSPATPSTPAVHAAAQCVGLSKTFGSTGSDQTFTVPAGCSSVTLTVAGAGGGGSGVSGRVGGAGGLSTGVLLVNPGDVLTIIVGRGGLHGSAASTYGGGGGAGILSAGINGCVGGSGGGRSAVRLAGVEVITAGGGGGAADCAGQGDGGSGGGLQGGAGTGPTPGQGGTQSGGGAGGHAGSKFTGGAALNDQGAGGGGGGGYYGGGGGSGAGQDSGGGGGSGFVGGVTSGVTQGGQGSAGGAGGADGTAGSIAVEVGTPGADGGTVDACPAGTCLGSDARCYGPCDTGRCTSIPAGTCSPPSAGGVRCCAPNPGNGKSGTSTTVTPTCAGGQFCGEGPPTCGPGAGNSNGCSFALCDCLAEGNACLQKWYVASSEGSAPVYYPCAGCDCAGVTGPMFSDCSCQCTPDCAGKTCGDDGCGGSCGTCAPGSTCASGACQPDAQKSCSVTCCCLGACVSSTFALTGGQACGDCLTIANPHCSCGPCCTLNSCN